MADTNPLLGALGPVGSIASDLINARQSRQNTERTIQANKEMAQYQYSKDLEMWNRGNAYNSPTAQMDRLKAAGLNPNMVYGNGSPQGATAQQLPKYNAPTMDYSHNLPVMNPGTALSAYQDFAIKNAQLDNLKAQRQNIVQDTLHKELINDPLANSKSARLWKIIYDANYANERYQQASWMNKYFPDFLKNRNRLQEQDLQNKIAGMNKITADTEFTQLKADWYIKKLFIDGGTRMLGSMLGAFGPGKWSKGAKGIEFQKPRSRYNSPQSWKDAGY